VVQIPADATLETALRDFTSPKAVDGGDVTRQECLNSCPENLIICLQRFANLTTKDKRVVGYRHHLELGEDLGLDQVVAYKLVAVVNHQGGLSGGHYTADVCREGQWYRCSDESCSPVTSQSVVRTPGQYDDVGEAYLLVYVKTEGSAAHSAAGEALSYGKRARESETEPLVHPPSKKVKAAAAPVALDAAIPR